jgi:hypothetical protein
MSRINHLFTSIVEEYNQKHPSKRKILSHLFSSQPEDYGSDFVDLVGRTLHFKPSFFMESLYAPFREKLGATCGDEKRREI